MRFMIEIRARNRPPSLDPILQENYELIMTHETSFEIIRHGDKQGKELSEKGREQARSKAREIYGEIRLMPPDAVVCLFSSNVGRAQRTEEEIVNALRELCVGDQDIEILSVQELKKIEEAKEQGQKKIVIVDTAPQMGLGFDEKNDPAEAAFNKYHARYQDENAIGKIWIARAQELPALKAELHAQYPGVDSSDINPADFIKLPEEFVLNFLRFLRRMVQISRKHFPDRPAHIVGVSHNYNADLPTLVLMGKPLNVASINELGGTFRDFMESSEFIFGEDGKTSVTYRREKTEIHQSIEEAIKTLKKSLEERKKEWER